MPKFDYFIYARITKVIIALIGLGIFWGNFVNAKFTHDPKGFIIVCFMAVLVIPLAIIKCKHCNNRVFNSPKAYDFKYLNPLNCVKLWWTFEDALKKCEHCGENPLQKE